MAQSTREMFDSALEVLPGVAGDALSMLGQRVAEAIVTGLETVVAQRPELSEVVVDPVDGPSAAAAFDGVDHMALDLQFTFADGADEPLVVLIPLEDVGALFMIDTSPEQMVDDEFARAQLEMVAAGLKELLDLASMLLFVDGLAGAEVTLQQVRLRAASESLAALDAISAGDALLRVAFEVALPESGSHALTAVLPRGLLVRLSDALGGEVGTGAPGSEAAPAVEAAGTAPTALGATADAAAAAGGEREPTVLGGATFAAGADGADGGADVHPVHFPPIVEQAVAAVPNQLDLIMDVSLRVAVELGRTRMTVEEVLELGSGSVVELNKLAGEPVDILVNEALIARGEVVVVDENFGVRVTEIVSPRVRAQAMSHA